mmetsp:Transcript_110812/g.294384  ORF Transcript_110812/g.294384 Transcript_110812/m.294384 type:complete len:573 (-) Transcript_110812:161-1879(-)
MPRVLAAAVAHLSLFCRAGAEAIFPDGTRPCQGPAEACPDMQDDTVQLQLLRTTEDSFHDSPRVDSGLMQRALSCFHQEFDSHRLITRKHTHYHVARKMVNDWDVTPRGVGTHFKNKPHVVLRPETLAQVKQALSCTAQFGFQVCAVSGQHGWSNGGGCDGGFMIDVQDLAHVQVDKAAMTVRFGAGNALGRIYHEMHAQAGLYIPAGVVSSVGPGLILGCGRGLATSILGLACDSILSVRYIDATGAEQVASATSNPDMFWLARGGAGAFPGIVVEYTMKAYEAPKDVLMTACAFFKRETQHRAEAALRKWFTMQEEMFNSSRRVYSDVQLFNSAVTVTKVYCLGCSPEQKTWAQQQVDSVDAAADGAGRCWNETRTWLDQILYESGAPKQAHVDWLLDRENGYGKYGNVAARGPQHINGRAYPDFNVSADLVSAMTDHCWHGPGEHNALFCAVYPIGGDKVTSVGPTETAYGNRDNKWTLLVMYAMMRGQSSNYYGAFKQASRMFQQDVDKHMPCRNFMNYHDTDGMECLNAARHSDEWLAAHFSNVTRMKEIKAAVDPNDVIRTIGMPR